MERTGQKNTPADLPVLATPTAIIVFLHAWDDTGPERPTT